MGPFVPDIIPDALNLIVALVMGIAFGIVLEQAGFSSSRKLAGVFYGYDFTVLRVFFTAGITAMLGVVLLGALGLLDTDMIYVNPTFLGPAIVGGMIMGVGFILGGYCPGTSLCAAAIGKKDAIAFVIGGIIGVYVFGELFPLYDVFFTSGALGPIKVFDALGMSQGVFILALVAVAILAFVLTTRIEKKVNAASPMSSFSSRKHVYAALALVAVGIAAFMLPDRKSAILAEIADPSYEKSHPVNAMSADELAFRVLDRDPSLVLVDVRPAAEFQAQALPGAVNIPLEGLFSKEWTSLLGTRHKHRVFVDNDGTRARQAVLLASRLGFTDCSMLSGGWTEFRTTVLDFRPPTSGITRENADTYLFRGRAARELPLMMSESRNGSTSAKAPAKKIVGGC